MEERPSTPTEPPTRRNLVIVVAMALTVIAALVTVSALVGA
ncbi:hypothetical protein [Nocardia sp. NPDC056100]